MRVVVDLQGAQTGSSRLRGIGRYSLGLIEHFARLRGEHEVFVALSGVFEDAIEPLRASLGAVLPQENILVWASTAATAHVEPLNTGRRHKAELVREAFLAALNPDWILVSSLFEGLDTDAITSIGALAQIPTAVVLYDLIPWIHPDIYLSNDRSRSWYVEKLDHLRRADLLLAISASSRDEAIDYLGFDAARVVNISTAADLHFKPRFVSDADRRYLRHAYGIRGPFVMYTGGIDPRKNIERLIAAFAQLPDLVREQHQLVIVCAAHHEERRRLKELAAELGLAEGDALLAGFVPENDLRLLYNAATLFAFPSWHEGFGLPVLEAMRCGTPVVAANRASLVELVREEARFDPFDVSDIASKLQKGLTDEAFRKTAAEFGLEKSREFSWEQTARRAWSALGATNARPVRSTPVGRRPRLAYVSPLPPEKSGIADYSAELLLELSRWYRVDVVVADPPAMSDPYVRATCGLASVEEFRRTAGQYDRVIYHFGNSEFHEHMFDLLAAIPGVVVLHDFFLSGIQMNSEVHNWRPYPWSRALKASHGYRAVADRYRAAEGDAAMRYPANLPVLQDALGVVVHSEVSRQLAGQWYRAGDDWAYIPHLRAVEVDIERAAARERLGVPEDAFVVCSFGILSNVKLHYRLLEAWLSAPLARQSHARLVFVGDASSDDRACLDRILAGRDAAARVAVTGWVDRETYRAWLAAGDVAVQLRSSSRGETSGAVLDCMSFGLATVVNAHGAMAELGPDAVWSIPDEFSDAELAEVLETLAREPGRRRALGERARAAIRDKHNPRRCAERYFEAIEGVYLRAERTGHGLTQRLAELPGAAAPDVALLLARNHPPEPRQRQLLFDVSVQAQTDARSGVQRVARGILLSLLESPPEGFQVEPVYASTESPGYRYARRFTSRFLGMPDDWAEDEPVEAWPGDVFLGCDLSHVAVLAQVDTLDDWRRRGVRVSFVVHDLLPIMVPAWFPEGVPQLHQRWLSAIARFDALIAVSKAVADELRDWLDCVSPGRERPLSLGWYHHGADIERSLPSSGLPENAPEVFAALNARPSFLTVGTVEPRKGHEQTLGAFEELWAQGIECNWVIIGQRGWRTEALIERLQRHPQLGRRLFWLEAASDEYLDAVYDASACLLAASEAEGFGLPLIEAARHRLPILARDIPVFREVAGAHATYFEDSLDAMAQASAIRGWIDGFRAGTHPRTDNMRVLTWAESAAQLLECVLEGVRCEDWEPVRKDVLRFWGNDVRLNSTVGLRRGKTISTTGQEGFLFFGPYVPLPKGRRRISIAGNADHWSGSERLDVVCEKGTRTLFQVDLHGPNAGEWEVGYDFAVDRDVTDMEIRLWVGALSRLSVSRIEIVASTAARATAELAPAGPPLSARGAALAISQAEPNVTTPEEGLPLLDTRHDALAATNGHAHAGPSDGAAR